MTEPAGSAGTRLHVPHSTLNAYGQAGGPPETCGLPGPRVNQSTVRYTAKNSNTSRYQTL